LFFDPTFAADPHLGIDFTTPSAFYAAIANDIILATGLGMEPLRAIPKSIYAVSSILLSI